jgi:hypothetical protein
MKAVSKSCVAVLVTVLGATACQAAQVIVSNSSFEDQALSAGGWTNNTPPGWQEPPPVNGGDSFTEYIAGFSSDGVNHEGIANRSFIFQDLGVPAQPLTSYTLTVGVGNRNDNFTQPGNISRFSLLAGGETGTVIATRDVDASTFADGSFQDFSAIGVTGAAAPAGNLTIRLEVVSTGTPPGNADRAHFDNVRLDASPVPEPSALGVLSAVSVAGLGLGRRRRTA